MFRKRADWVQCAESLGVSFTTYHRDDAPHDVITAANGNYPIVLGRTASSLEIVLNNAHDFEPDFPRQTWFLLVPHQ
jgi:hypothetical protein